MLYAGSCPTVNCASASFPLSLLSDFLSLFFLLYGFSFSALWFLLSALWFCSRAAQHPCSDVLGAGRSLDCFPFVWPLRHTSLLQCACVCVFFKRELELPFLYFCFLFILSLRGCPHLSYSFRVATACRCLIPDALQAVTWPAWRVCAEGLRAACSSMG